MAKQTHDMVMTIDDLAKYLKLSTSTLYKLCAEAKVPGRKLVATGGSTGRSSMGGSA